MKQGLTNSEACRLVGISRSTGQHWRHGPRLRNKGREYYYRLVNVWELGNGRCRMKDAGGETLR
jgi:hypothetical protein